MKPKERWALFVTKVAEHAGAAAIALVVLAITAGLLFTIVKFQ